MNFIIVDKKIYNSLRVKPHIFLLESIILCGKTIDKNIIKESFMEKNVKRSSCFIKTKKTLNLYIVTHKMAALVDALVFNKNFISMILLSAH